MPSRYTNPDFSIRRIGDRDGKQCIYVCVCKKNMYIYIYMGRSFVYLYNFQRIPICFPIWILRYKSRLEILYNCADGIDRDGDLDLADGELDAYRDKKSAKELNQLEVAIGDGMEFTIHGKRIENESIIF